MPYTYMSNSLMNFDKLLVDNTENVAKNSDLNITRSLNVSFYDRGKILAIKNLISELNEGWYTKKIIPNNSTLEKISYELYGSTKYWDILLLINERMPIFDMPYDYDVISDAGESAVSDYEERIYRKQILKQETRDRFKERYQNNQSKENEQFRIIKYIKKDLIYDFLNLINKLQ